MTSLSKPEMLRLAASKTRVTELYRQYAQIAFSRRAQFEMWEHYAFGCIERAHFALESVYLLQEREADQAALTRVLYEHVVAFAWLMINPTEHYLELLSAEHHERQKMQADMAKHMLDPSIMSDADTVTMYMVTSGYNPTVKAAPTTPGRAFAADKHWTAALAKNKHWLAAKAANNSDAELEAWEFRFRHGFASIFRALSIHVHPTLMGITPFSSVDDAAQVGKPRQLITMRLDAEALAVFTDVLVVASLSVWGWPPNVLQVFAALFEGVEDSDGAPG